MREFNQVPPGLLAKELRLRAELADAGPHQVEYWADQAEYWRKKWPDPAAQAYIAGTIEPLLRARLAEIQRETDAALRNRGTR